MRYTCSDADCLCSNPPPPAPMSRPVATPPALEVLGVLAREIQRDTLPLWPTQPCRFCGTDSVAVIDGDGYCEGHAMGYRVAEDEVQS